MRPLALIPLLVLIGGIGRAGPVSETIAKPFTFLAGDETVAGYGAGDGAWQLVQLDGVKFGAIGYLRFEAAGRITGAGPCNRFGGKQTAPYPWFRAERILSTKRACPDMAAESDYFQALQAMTLAEVQGDVLILSTPEGREMIFHRVPDPL